jgi:putative transcriptional regulator
MMTVRWRVRELAEPERWSARKLAEAADLAYGTVWPIWNGKAKRVDLETLDALCRVLKVEPGDLLRREPGDLEIGT